MKWKWFHLEAAHCFHRLSASLALAGLAMITSAADGLEQDNVVWTTPSTDASGSMPLGNGDLGVNVWVQPNGDLLIYVGKTDAWSENHRLLKLGLIRVSGLLDPAESFRQVLDLSRGTIEIQAGQGTTAASVTIWVDANFPVIQIDATSQSKVAIDVTSEPWRIAPRQLTGDELHSAYGLHGGNPDPVMVTPDTIIEGQSDRIAWYHRNKTSIWAGNLNNIGLDSSNTAGTDPLLHRTFGAVIEGSHLGSVGNTTLRSTTPQTRHTIKIHALTAQTETAEVWREQLDTLIDQTNRVSDEQRKAAHQQWWSEFNARSYIRISGSEQGRLVSRGYALQRAMNAFSGRGGSPIKFNGSIFTVDTKGGLDADYRQWGGPYWFQNTRFPYWSMLASGDIEMMMPLFDMYLDALALAKESVKAYWGHDGAYFPETIYLWGSANNGNYGWPNQRGDLPEGTMVNRYIRFKWQGALELSMMMLETYNITRDDTQLREKVLPFVQEIVTFYDQHYQRDARGRLEIAGHAQVLETWWTATNPMPDIAGLHAVLDRLIALPVAQTTRAQRTQWQRLKGELPDLPTRILGDGTEIFAPADAFSEKKNVQNGELYGVFPYLRVTVGNDRLQMGVDTYINRYHQANRGWGQDVINAALLGLTDQAKSQVIGRYTSTDHESRFPGFYGPNYDWRPDQTHPNVANIALQKMLMQVNGDHVELFPAWPEDWDVTFKLHGPAGAILMGQSAGGQVLWMDPTLDGKLDQADLELIRKNMGTGTGQTDGDYASLQLGDANLDGQVNQADVDIISEQLADRTPGSGG